MSTLLHQAGQVNASPPQQQGIQGTTLVVNILELALQIGQYLSMRSLTVSVRVCKQWHQLFLPRIWRAIDIVIDEYDHLDTIVNDPIIPALKSHACHVQTLRIVCQHLSRAYRGMLGNFYFPHLTELLIDTQYRDFIKNRLSWPLSKGIS
jgi:hypothetical protein